MFNLFDSVKGRLGYKQEHATIESSVFGAMKVAVVATLAAVVVVTAKTYVGDNISCVTGFKGQTHKAIQNYCFISSTYTVLNMSKETQAHVGVGPHVEEEDDVTHHAYYQWVPFVLSVQVAVLYLPKWLWKGYFDMHRFITILNKLNTVKITDLTRQSDIQKSAHYLAVSLGTHTAYALEYHLCELLAFVVACGNLFMTNSFLGGAFFGYGGSAFSYLTDSNTDPMNPMNIVFPKVTKCLFSKYGTSGSIEQHDALCVLPMNVVNEKTYVVLWFVYLFTTGYVGVVLMGRLLLLLSPASRDTLLLRRLPADEARLRYRALAPSLSYGDWFLLRHLGRAMAPRYFGGLLEALALERGVKRGD